jgi:hypothetical protein
MHAQIAANGNVQKEGKGRKRAIMMTLVDKEAAEVLASIPPADLQRQLGSRKGWKATRPNRFCGNIDPREVKKRALAGAG